MSLPLYADLVAYFLTAEAADPRYGEVLRAEAAVLVALIAGRSDAAALLDEADRRQFDLAQTIALFLRARHGLETASPPERPAAIHVPIPRATVLH